MARRTKRWPASSRAHGMYGLASHDARMGAISAGIVIQRRKKVAAQEEELLTGGFHNNVKSNVLAVLGPVLNRGVGPHFQLALNLCAAVGDKRNRFGIAPLRDF